MNYHEISLKNITRKSGFVLAGIMTMLYIMFSIRGHNYPLFGLLAFLLAVLTLVDAKLLHLVVDLLIKWGNFMHRFTNPVVFGIIYLVAVIPTSLVLKLLGKEVIQTCFDVKAVSYWRDRSYSKPRSESFRNQY